MAQAVEKLAETIKGKESLAIKAFAKGLRALPAIIADNGGYDSSELVQNLIFEIKQGNESFGLDMSNGTLACMKANGITVYLSSYILGMFKSERTGSCLCL